MVDRLQAPPDPLPRGRSWIWEPRGPGREWWRWCRVYHRSTWTPDAVTARRFGPLHRMDPHLPTGDGEPQLCPDGRSVLYVAGNLATGLGEVFGDAPVAQVCPRFRVAIVEPRVPLALFDLRSEGAAMAIGALPSLATGPYLRQETQAWARAMYEGSVSGAEQPHGVYYDAAHTNGPALALWDTDDEVAVVIDDGQAQDFALADPRMWARVIRELVDLGRTAELISEAECEICARGSRR